MGLQITLQINSLGVHIEKDITKRESYFIRKMKRK